VEAAAEDAIRAKSKAMAEGQQAAFRSLLKRIVPVTAYERLKRLKSIKAADLVDGVSVRSERNSSTEYIANLDFAFQPQAVRDLLRREGVPFIDEQAPPATVIPVLIEGGAVKGTGPWLEAWTALDAQHTLTPLKLEAPRGALLTPGTIKGLGEGEDNAARSLAGEYRADRVLVASAEVDAATSRLNVTLAGTDAVGPFRLKRSYRLGSDQSYTLELAAVIGLGVIEGRWKAVKAAARGGVELIGGPGEPVRLEAEFSSMGEWNDIRRRLNETAGVDGLTIDGLSARTAELSLRFPGGAAQLSEALAPRGLSLRNAGGTWVLRSSF
jgi:hypothetical protein